MDQGICYIYSAMRFILIFRECGMLKQQSRSDFKVWGEDISPSKCVSFQQVTSKLIHIQQSLVMYCVS